jgi:hypothetical protein
MVNEDSFWVVIVSALTFVTWLPNFVWQWRAWRSERTPRSFRHFFIATMVQVGLLRIVLSASARAWPTLSAIQVVNLVTAPILTIMLLSGGLVAIYTWRSGVRP